MIYVFFNRGWLLKERAEITVLQMNPQMVSQTELAEVKNELLELKKKVSELEKNVKQ